MTLKRRRATRASGLVVVTLMAPVLLWLASTEDARVWPVRSTMHYHALKWWTRTGAFGGLGGGSSGAPGSVRGMLRDPAGRPIAGGRVLVSRWDGTTYSTTSVADGSYVIRGVPPGRYVPVATAIDYADAPVGPRWGPARPVAVRSGAEARGDLTLPPEPHARATPGKNLEVGTPERVFCTRPVASQATRRRITFDSDGRSNQLTFLYRPTGPGAVPGEAPPAQAAPDGWLPVVLTVYPGAADEWECVSLSLATAGYAVLAVGPAYSLELERDVDELVRLLAFARTWQLPGADGARLAVLAGSYSALHVQRLLRRDRDLAAVVLLGPPTDLFDMRRRFEDRTFVPPFGLDQALIALGFPDRQPLRYWRYSGVHHVRPDFPPLLLMHSRADDVVPFQQSEQLAAALADKGVPHELHILEGASHYLLSNDADALTIYHRTLDFLARHLS